MRSTCSAPSRGFLALCLALPGVGVHAGGLPATTLDTMTVTSEGEANERPQSAAEGLVSFDQLAARPVARIAELLEFVPGLIATQHSGEGKANQYFLRGFNLDHGTDFATFVDGMPVNLRSHGHGQGYSDLNFLIPELVSTLEYRKGPYYADVGDFSAAGSADIALAQSIEAPLLKLSVGEDSERRGLLAASPRLGEGFLLAALEVARDDGPWVLDAQLQKTNAVLRYSQGSEREGLSISAMAYDNEWVATDQIPARAVRSGQIDRLGFIDPTVGGESSRYSLSFDWRRRADSGHWSLAGYAIDYALDLFSNFTYFLEDPINGDQFEQLDERQVYGLSGHRHWPLQLGGRKADIEIGAQLRHDAIDQVGLFRTASRQRLSTVRLDAVDETSLGLFVQSRIALTPRLRAVAGLRLDYFAFDVRSDLVANSGSDNDAILGPKLSLAYTVSQHTELFLNLGRGFHSNDARGTTIRIDPASGTAADPVDPLVAADAVDLGVVAQVHPSTKLAATAWLLELDSELVFVGDGGATEESDASRRFGIELAAYITPRPWLIVDLDYAWTRARLDVASNADRIPNAVETVASAGVTLLDSRGFSGGLRLRFLGEAPLIEDNSARSQTTTVLNLELAYRPMPTLRIAAGLFNLLDSRDQDITYFYESRLAGEPAAGVADVHFHPVEPRNLRWSVEWQF